MVEVPFSHQRNVHIAPHTTLELGGPAELWTEAFSAPELIRRVRWARELGVPLLLLGGGSNLVVSDQGFDGLVVAVRVPGFEVSSQGWARLGAGESWDEVVRRLVNEGWNGVECLSGIPGTVGATPIQNVGAYGQEIAQVLQSVEVYNRTTDERSRLTREQCEFGYRSSVFKQNPERFVVLEVHLHLRRQPAQPRYAQLVEAMEGQELSGLRLRQEVLRLRRSKSMVWQEDDPNRRSVGSFFMNPKLSKEEASLLASKSTSEGWVSGPSEMPSFVEGDMVKIPAAWLVERCGFPKGYRLQEVGVSSKHALALVHHGGGSARQLMQLANQIRDKVERKTGIRLEVEPRRVGFAPSA